MEAETSDYFLPALGFTNEVQLGLLLSRPFELELLVVGAPFQLRQAQVTDNGDPTGCGKIAKGTF